jgi:hypothetical protein
MLAGQLGRGRHCRCVIPIVAGTVSTPSLEKFRAWASSSSSKCLLFTAARRRAILNTICHTHPNDAFYLGFCGIFLLGCCGIHLQNRALLADWKEFCYKFKRGTLTNSDDFKTKVKADVDTKLSDTKVCAVDRRLDALDKKLDDVKRDIINAIQATTPEKSALLDAQDGKMDAPDHKLDGVDAKL